MTCDKPISVLKAQLVAYLLLVDLLHVLEVVLLLQLAHQHRLLVRIRRVLLLCVRTELRERLRVQRVLLRFQHSTTSHLCICLSSPSKSPKNLFQTLVGWVNTKIPTQVRKVTYYMLTNCNFISSGKKRVDSHTDTTAKPVRFLNELS